MTEYGKGTKWGYGDSWKADHAAGRFQRLEDSWAEHTAYIEKAGELVTPLLATQLQTLAQSVAVPGRRVVVFNPLPWPRDGEVAVSLPDAGIAALQARRRRASGTRIASRNDSAICGPRTFRPWVIALSFRWKRRPWLPICGPMSRRPPSRTGG